MKRLLLFMSVIMGFMALGVGAGAETRDGHQHADSESLEGWAIAEVEAGEEALVDVGNRICPVSGEKVGSMGPGVQVEHKGKIYHLCCAMCVEEFRNKIEKYTAIAENEVKDSQHHEE